MTLRRAIPRSCARCSCSRSSTDEQLDRLCASGHVELIEPGPVFREGDPATCFYVLIEGTLVLTRQVGADDVEIDRTDQSAACTPGAWQAYLGDRVPQTYNELDAGRPSPSRFFVLDAETFAEADARVVPDGGAPAGGPVLRHPEHQQVTQQRERLLALGSLSAGLTHELNNPAAAAVRATVRAARAGGRHAAQAGDHRRRASTTRAHRAADRSCRRTPPSRSPRRRR